MRQHAAVRRGTLIVATRGNTQASAGTGDGRLSTSTAKQWMRALEHGPDFCANKEQEKQMTVKSNNQRLMMGFQGVVSRRDIVTRNWSIPRHMN